MLTSNSVECFNSTIFDERRGSYLYVFTSFSDKFAVHVRMQTVINEIPLELMNKREAFIRLGSERKITAVGPDLFTVTPLASRKKPDKSDRVVDLK